MRDLCAFMYPLAESYHLRIRSQLRPSCANSRMLKLAHFCYSLLSSSTPTVQHKRKCTLDRSIWLASAYYKRKMQNKQDERGGSEYKHTKWHTQLIQQLYSCASYQCEIEDEVEEVTPKRVGTVKGRDEKAGRGKEWADEKHSRNFWRCMEGRK